MVGRETRLPDPALSVVATLVGLRSSLPVDWDGGVRSGPWNFCEAGVMGAL